jgi:hypothetical protein
VIDRPDSPAAGRWDQSLPYGTPIRVTPDRISLTCLATCQHGNACGLIGERRAEDGVSLYFHGTEVHGARLTPAQIHALATWLSSTNR